MTTPLQPTSALPQAAAPAAGAGAVVQGAAALLWLPQAAVLALAVEGMAAGRGFAAVIWPAFAIVLLGVFRAALEAWGARRVFALARRQLTVLRAQAASALANASPLDRSRAPSGRAASVLGEQAEALVPYLVRYQPARWRVRIVPLAILCVVGWFSWVAALVLLCAAPLIPVFMAIVGWRAKAASEAQMVELGGMNAFLLDRLRGLATLRALGAVEATALRLGGSAQSLRVRTMAVLRIAFMSSAVLELFSALGVAMVAAYVGFHLLGTLGFGAWGRTLSLGEGMFVLLLAPAFFEPLRELSAVWHDRAAGEATLQSLGQLQRHAMPLSGANVSLGTVPDGAAPAVVVRGLRFSWPGEPQAVFDGIDVRIAGGEHIALTGASGAGKTALLSLVAGLVPASRGEIVIGGVPLSDRSIAGLRERMAWMGQMPHVFAGTVARNVTLGRAVDEGQVPDALRFAALGDVARADLGEGGSGLSGGEAVRLALARIAVHTRADLLLVDEPTAHLDTETARRVTDALLQLAEGKTLIVATHDPVLIARMNRTLCLDADVMEQAA